MRSLRNLAKLWHVCVMDSKDSNQLLRQSTTSLHPWARRWTLITKGYDKLNWETRTGDKGPFQMLRKDNRNNTQLLNHLEAILKQNENHISMDDYHYWAGDPGYIFRRKKKQERPRPEK